MQTIPIRNARIIVLAMAAGTVLMSVLFLVLRLSGAPVTREVALPLELVIPALGLANAGMYLVVRRVLLARAREQSEACRAALRAGNLPRELFLVTLIGCAMAEAVGLLGAVVYFLGGHALLLVAPALAMAAILMLFPSAERSEAALSA